MNTNAILREVTFGMSNGIDEVRILLALPAELMNGKELFELGELKGAGEVRLTLWSPNARKATAATKTPPASGASEPAVPVVSHRRGRPRKNPEPESPEEGELTAKPPYDAEAHLATALPDPFELSDPGGPQDPDNGWRPSAGESIRIKGSTGLIVVEEVYPDGDMRLDNGVTISPADLVHYEAA